MAPLLTRLGLIGLALVLFIFADHASATFDFPKCVRKCMGKTDVCPKLRPKCVCQTDDKFLSAVLDCMADQCPDDLRDADDSFIGIMEKGCKVARRPLDDKILERADAHASALRTNKYNPPKTTDNKPTITDDSPPTKQTEEPAPTVSDDEDGGKGGKETPAPSPPPPKGKATTSTTEPESPTEAALPSTSTPAAQTNDNDRGSPNTAAVAPNTPPAPTTPPTNSGGTSNQGSGGFGDDSPFGNPNRSGASKGKVAGFIASAVLPLAAAAFFFL